MSINVNDKVVKELANDWQTAGVAEGDMLLVHSSISRVLRRISKIGGEVSPQLIIKSFLLALGKSGTLLLPLFNFDFPKGIPFDIRTSPSQMGALTEAARLWSGTVRTGHPIYSFAVIGKNAEMFRDLKNFSGYGQDSPFGILHRNKGKIGVIDLPDQNSMTFYHYIEEFFNAPYRYHKTFTGQYIDGQGVKSTENFGLFVRKVDQGVITHVNPMGEILWKKGFYTGNRPKIGCGLRVISAEKMFDEVGVVLNQGIAKGLLYDIQ